MVGGTRERILDAARSLLAVGGPRAVTVNGIAQVIRVTPPALYKHFKSRDDIVGELVREASALFQERLRRAVRRGRSPSGRLLALGVAYVDFGLDEPQRYRVLFGASQDDFQQAQADQPLPLGGGLDLLLALVKECQAAGVLSPRRNALEQAIGFWASAHGLVSLYLDAGGATLFTRASYKALARRALAHLLAIPLAADQ